MGWEQFRREVGEWIGIQSPEKKPSSKKTVQSSARESGGETREKKERPLVQLREGESLPHFAKRAKEAYERKGKEFDYSKVLLEAVGARTKEQVIEKHGEPWYKQIKNVLSERTDTGVLVQTCGLYALGASVAIGSHYLPGEWGYIAPVLFAFGGERYLKGMIKTIMYLGEDALKRLIDTAHVSLRKEIKLAFKKGSMESVDAGLKRIKQRDIDFRKTKEWQRKLEPWMRGFEFMLPKVLMATGVTGLIPHTQPIPVPLGFQDWDGKALPIEKFNPVFQNLKTGALHFATDLTAGIGNFGKFIVDQSDSISKVAPAVFKGAGEQIVYSTAALGVGVGLVGKEVVKGTASGVTVGARVFYNFAGRLVAAAVNGTQRLAEILERPPTAKDIDTIRGSKKPVRHRVPRTQKTRLAPKTQSMSPSRVPQESADFETVLKRAIEEGRVWGRQDSPEAKALIAELNRRAQEDEEMKAALAQWETESPAFEPQTAEKELSRVPIRVALSGAKQVRFLPEVTGKFESQELREIMIADDVWTLSANEARARITEAMGFNASETKSVSYKHFKAQLQNFIRRSGVESLTAIENFLKDNEGNNDHVLNGSQTKDNKAILMWIDRQQLRTLLKARRQEIVEQQGQEHTEQSGQEPWPVWADIMKEGERQAMQSDRETQVQTDERFGPSWDVRYPPLSSAHTLGIPTHARDTLKKLLARHISQKRPGVPVKILRDLQEIDTWGRKHIARRLLEEISSVVTAPHMYRENEYEDAWNEAHKVEMFKQDLIRVQLDEKKDWVFRGPVNLQLRPEGILLRGRLNIHVTVESTGALDYLIRDGARFFYRIGRPQSDVSSATRHDSITIFFGEPPSKKLLNALSRVSALYARETIDNLCGDKITPHFYMADFFSDSMPVRHAEKFLSEITFRDPEIAAEIKKFVGPKNNISEEAFNAIKKTLREFDVPIRYLPKEGVVFIEHSKSASVA